MLIGVNALTLEPDGGGEDRYLRRLLVTMRQIQPDTQFLIFTDPANHDSFAGWDRAPLDPDRRRGLFSGRDAQLERAAKQRGVDALFSCVANAPARVSVPVVLYALDLLRWEVDYRREHREDEACFKRVKQICADAAAIVAPSGFLQRKYLELLDVPLNKVIVAPLGVDEAFGRPSPCIVPQPYLLTVGSTRRFKNVPRFRDALEQLRDHIPHGLVVVGRRGEAEPDDWGDRVIRIEECPLVYLAGLYQHCDVFVQPSLYEGSGVTVLEAMRAGAIAATSRSGGIPEVAGDTPIFFNPESTASIVAAIRWAVAEEPAHRQSRIKFGKQVAAEYTWERCAWKTLSAFKRT
jgi:alpha-1,3-rhamnosyl/mannosyltransferase